MEVGFTNGETYYELGCKVPGSLIWVKSHNLYRQASRDYYYLEKGKYTSELEGNLLLGILNIDNYYIFGREYNAGKGNLQVAVVKEKIYPLLRQSKQQETKLLKNKTIKDWLILI